MHSSLNPCGGAERLCIAVIKALQKDGNKVTLVTTDKTNWSLLKKQYDLICKLERQLFLIPNMLQISSMMSRAVLTFSSYLAELFLLRLRGNHDLLINTSGEVIDLMTDIAYINAVPMRMAFNYPEGLPVKNTWWRCYSRVYNLFLKSIEKMNGNSLLITNSKFNELIIREFSGRPVLVVYPPVDVEKFKQLFRNKKRKNLVITVSRFRPGKNLEFIPKIAKLVRNSKFLIIGPSDKASETTIKRIKKSARKLDVQDRIQLLTNKPLSVLLRMLSEAKILLHTQFNEAFGMSVVEAMAAGCVPVVPRAGGPWFDILDREQGKYGYAYNSLGEAAEKISLLMSDERLRTEISRRAFERAKRFDRSFFEKKMVEVIHKVAVSKLKQ